MACLLEGKGGTRERRRYCANPFPVHGGKKCAGKNSERGECVELVRNSVLSFVTDFLRGTAIFEKLLCCVGIHTVQGDHGGQRLRFVDLIPCPAVIPLLPTLHLPTQNRSVSERSSKNQIETNII